MTNAELIKALRICGHASGCPEFCPIYRTYENGLTCAQHVIFDAADALEAADKRIARLEEDLKTREAEREVMQDTIKVCEEAADRYKAQLPKDGEWIVTTEVSDDGAVTSHINCSRCGFYWREPKHGKVFKRCPNCGARMKGENDEADS